MGRGDSLIYPPGENILGNTSIFPGNFSIRPVPRNFKEFPVKRNITHGMGAPPIGEIGRIPCPDCGAKFFDRIGRPCNGYGNSKPKKRIFVNGRCKFRANRTTLGLSFYFQLNATWNPRPRIEGGPVSIVSLV